MQPPQFSTPIASSSQKSLGARMGFEMPSASVLASASASASTLSSASIASAAPQHFVLPDNISPGTVIYLSDPKTAQTIAVNPFADEAKGVKRKFENVASNDDDDDDDDIVLDENNI